MKLTNNCPKCGKSAIIQKEVSLGKDLICFTYQCGHGEIKTKLASPEDISSELNELLAQANPPEETRLKTSPDLTATVKPREVPASPEELSRWVSDGGLIEDTSKASPNPNYVPLSYYSTDLEMCAYPFQRTGIHFAEGTQLRCLIADAMGLGKTIQAVKSITRNKQVTYPCLAVVKGATLFQWQNEWNMWGDKDFWTCRPITKRSDIIPGFNFYIISMDMLSKKDVIEKLVKLKIKSVIVDEVQNFKDSTAKRTEGLYTLLKDLNLKHILALSGTPIKNRVGEFGVILNILAPGYFPNATLDYKWFLPETKEVKSIDRMTGKEVIKLKTVYERLHPARAQEFFDLTSRFMIRREKHEVLRNLPSLTRDYQIVEINDQDIKDTYNRTLDLFGNWLKDNKSGITSSQVIGWLAQLRSITGQAKCKLAIDWIKDFLESTDESLAVGIHHTSVRDTLYYVLQNIGLDPLKLSGEDNVYKKNEIVRKFTSGANRLLVINSIAGGVGLNLQTCANALVLERQWNSADEEQFESRFHRNGQKQAVTITYMLAKGTIDEYFHEMVLRKRKVLAEAKQGVAFDLASDMESLLTLANTIVSHKI